MKKAILIRFLVAVGAILFALQPLLASDPEAYQKITDQIYFYDAPGQTLESMLWSSPTKYEAATAELHKMITNAALAAVIADHASSQNVAKAIEDLQGKFTLSALYDGSNIPFADLREVAGFRTLFLAVSIMRGGMGIPKNLSLLQYYSDRSGTWKLVSEESGLYDGSIFSVANLEPRLADEARYLTWGKAIGDGHAVYKIRGYSFDGASVQTFYSRDNLWGGQVSVLGNHVSLVYQEKAEPFAPERFIREDLEAGVGGIREVSREYLNHDPRDVGQGKK